MKMITGPSSERTRQAQLAFVLIEWLLVLMLICGMGWGVYVAIGRHTMAGQCRRNLENIYSALELYEAEHGTLPRLAFFPDDATHDRDSLLVALRAYEPDANVFICPAIRRYYPAGTLTYIWNIKLNGKKIHAADSPAWMLVEINALSDNVPLPHFTGYNILYTDGRVRASHKPPMDLRSP